MEWPSSLHLPADDSGHRSMVRGLFGIEQSFVRSMNDLIGPQVRRLYAWWERANEGRVPLKRQFDIVDHPQLAPHIYLVQRQSDGSYMFRLHGAEAERITGTKRLDMPVGELPDPAYARVLTAYYDEIGARRQPGFCRGTLVHFSQSWQRFESIDCPLSSNGTDIDHIVGVIETLHPAEPPGAADPLSERLRRDR